MQIISGQMITISSLLTISTWYIWLTSICKNGELKLDQSVESRQAWFFTTQSLTQSHRSQRPISGHICPSFYMFRPSTSIYLPKRRWFQMGNIYIYIIPTAPNTFDCMCGWLLWSKHLRWPMMYLEKSGIFKQICFFEAKETSFYGHFRRNMMIDYWMWRSNLSNKARIRMSPRSGFVQTSGTWEPFCCSPWNTWAKELGGIGLRISNAFFWVFSWNGGSPKP